MYNLQIIRLILLPINSQKAAFWFIFFTNNPRSLILWESGREANNHNNLDGLLGFIGPSYLIKLGYVKLSLQFNNPAKLLTAPPSQSYTSCFLKKSTT